MLDAVYVRDRYNVQYDRELCACINEAVGIRRGLKVTGNSITRHVSPSSFRVIASLSSWALLDLLEKNTGMPDKVL